MARKLTLGEWLWIKTTLTMALLGNDCEGLH